ncbi:TPA: hypothetical protein SI574_004601 [Escherichia coli]|nr:conjugal transfer protein TraG [Escherichia coli]EGZ8549820.1 conjugal transfer protein TraG [Escherichia coli]EHS6972583.1 hypothetical protein [Escherichia coli]EKL2553837.1 hypothetical protein [Escherichia coli]ELL4717276.1 hypothetical protein [Escherichia coli]
MVGGAWLAEQAFSDHALSPHSAWSNSASRDAGLADTGAGGYPTCKQWWADDTVGLKARLLQLPALDIWTAFKKIGQSQVVYEEAVLRSRVSERNMQVSQNGRVYPGYDVIINLVMRLMFLVLPTFWLGAMMWAGVRVGVALNGALAGGIKAAQGCGGKTGGMIGR